MTILQQIDKACGKKDFNTVLNLCKKYDMSYLGLFLCTIFIRQRGFKDNNDDLTKFLHIFQNNLSDGEKNVSITEEYNELNPLDKN
jgi:hypothetical protein